VATFRSFLVRMPSELRYWTVRDEPWPLMGRLSSVPARRWISARLAGVPGRCCSSGPPALRMTERRTRATIITSSAYPMTGRSPGPDQWARQGRAATGPAGPGSRAGGSDPRPAVSWAVCRRLQCGQVSVAWQLEIGHTGAPNEVVPPVPASLGGAVDRGVLRSRP
jgi:hypothetical protein